MKYYRVRDGYITGRASGNEDGSIRLPDGYIDDDIIRDNAYSIGEDGGVELSEKYLAKRNLNNTDWKMIRHRDQIALGIETSLTNEEYQEVLTNRQTWRNII